MNKIQLDESNTTLIIGKNGSGKSTAISAISFALFGKPFRNITKGQIVNSINKKDCLVQIEFESNDKLYKVISQSLTLFLRLL
jgi:DNA repair exonuclease SbcCD ATPase subunit